MLLYLDCIGGVAGDMLLGALLDAGATVDLCVVDLEIERGKAERHGIVATTTKVVGAAEQPHRDWGTIRSLIDAADLPERARERAQEAFRRLAVAEGKIHGIEPERVHFHEVGAIDAIGEIIGVALALESLNIDRVICSPLPLGPRVRRRPRTAGCRCPRRRPSSCCAARPIYGVEVDARAGHADRRGAGGGARRGLRPGPAHDHRGRGLRRRDARPRGAAERRARDARARVDVRRGSR